MGYMEYLVLNFLELKPHKLTEDSLEKDLETENDQQSQKGDLQAKIERPRIVQFFHFRENFLYSYMHFIFR